MKRLSGSELRKYADPARLAELEEYLIGMNDRGLDEHYGRPVKTTDFALDPAIMYFQALLLSPCDRRMMARDIMGVPWLSEENKVCNAAIGYWYGPTNYLIHLTGVTDTSRAHVDFDRVYVDQDYVEQLRSNLAFTRKHGHQVWTTTELHTSLQTEGRNYCREKYKDPERKANSLDIVEWMAYLKRNGWAKRILEASSMEEAFNRFCEPRGIGPYFGGNSIAMIANSRAVAYSHEENFTAPGGGAVSSLEYIFESMRQAGHKLNHLRLIQWLVDEQEVLFPRLTVPAEFQNMPGWDGQILKKDQTRYTANSFEVGLCQFSVYRKIKEKPELAKRRPDTKWDLTPFKLREQGMSDAEIDERMGIGSQRKSKAFVEEPIGRTDLLEF